MLPAFNKKYLLVVLCSYCLGMGAVNAQNNRLAVEDHKESGAFPLFASGKLATLLVDTVNDAKVVRIAAKMFGDDLKTITGTEPKIVSRLQEATTPVIIGTVGRSVLIDSLIARKQIRADSVKGKWETFCLSVIDDPYHRHGKALVIFGSDPRGTAYGVLEVSRLMGVSPLVWWADVTPVKKASVYITAGKSRLESPSVKYRGFFINDEDWGMRPWAARNMDKDIRDIGPNTYRKVFELMLRLKANYLWPAMHPGTKAFWYYKQNPALARDYDIIMGSSHHEPMLRNTEWEWNADYKEEYGHAHGEWRYDLNKKEIYRFFDDRVKQSVDNDAVYTIGMRSTSDGPMKGPSTAAGKIKILQDVINDQREILANRLNKPANKIPQVFCPYKEVLDLYEAGLKIPEDVTILWVDDNHGYIRQLPSPEEQGRSGGGGVYYHFSYWGTPRDYLWLSSTSPALTSFEMSKAYALQARTMWVFNVGDLKPAELELQFAMDLAWNVKAWSPEKAHLYPAYWGSATFGKAFGKEIGLIKEAYYHLAASGKPEHLDAISLTDEDIRQRLDDYGRLAAQTERLAKKIPARLQDAYFELISYPVEAAYCMNKKIGYAQKSLQLAKEGKQTALSYAEKAKAAYERIGELTRQYNKVIAGGKWDAMMDDHPRKGKIFDMPAIATAAMIAPKETAPDSPHAKIIKVAAGNYKRSRSVPDHLWMTVKGLGESGEGLTLWPMLIRSFNEKDIALAPYVDYRLKMKKGGNSIRVKCLPLYPLYPSMKLRFAIAVDKTKPIFVNIAAKTDTKSWATNVLRGYSEGEIPYESKRDGQVTVRIYFPDPGLVINSIGASAVADSL